MSITVHPELEAKLRARAEAEGITVEAYIERIARDAEQAEQELEMLALEGLNSGESIEVGPGGVIGSSIRGWKTSAYTLETPSTQ